MKKAILVCLAMVAVLPVVLFSQDAPKPKKLEKMPFFVYNDKGDRQNHFFPSGWMGDVGDIKINDAWATGPQSGKTCIQIKYTGERKQGAGWAGIYWQNPANNWGTKHGGFNLSAAKKMVFYARGEKGGETVEFKVGGITGDYPDSGAGSTGKIELKKTWEMYTIDLSTEDMSYMSGGFCVVFSGDDAPEGLTLYLDNIYYTDKK